jgi:signal-transduction protein with cAMP-binding, CBS, and nucleotidyltransferase domain/PAS domain-containing protein
MRSRRRILILKIDLPALLAFAFFAGLIFFYLIPGFEKVMMDRKRNLIHEITSSAYSLLEHYHSLELKGTLSTEQAKEEARAAIGAIRYGETLKDYFWITDMHPVMIFHPYRPDLNGSDLTDFRDSKGKAIFVEFVKAVSPTGESYVDYMWQWNDDSTRNVPKLSYVKLYKPWGWIIGTGIYIEDVKSEIHRMELSALIISGIIGIGIIILLIVISGQSHKIEQKRNKAEEDLRKSKELYRTLSEAASEGVLIWSLHGLQANKILLSWLGYTEEELKTITFHEIFISPEIKEIVDPESLYEELNSRRFIESFIRIRNGNLINTHAEFSRIIIGEMRAVLFVIRPVNTLTVQAGISQDTRLFNNISTGFFRISYGRKGRFLYASKAAIGIFGFNSFQEILPYTFDSFFFDQDQLRSYKYELASKKPFLNKEILLKKKSGSCLWVMVNIVIIGSDSSEIWCEGTIEEIAASFFQNSLIPPDLAMFSSTFILKCPVSAFMLPPVNCIENLTVKDAIKIMKEKNTHFLIVMNKSLEPVGVAEAGDIGFRIAEGGSPETEIFRWMRSPPDFISQDTEIADVFGIFGASTKKYLLATDDENKLTGIITSSELAYALSGSPELLCSEISNAKSSADLLATFLKCRRMAVSMIFGKADPYSISLFISSVADEICRKVLILCIEERGEPPCRFAFLQTGSAGRREQTLLTDQDNGILFENCEGERLKKANEYFLSLGRKVNAMLAETGFLLCKGDNMAGNQKWCQPVSVWKRYFSDWINNPGPEELLTISIFFDFRFCFGDPGLSDELSKYVRNDLKTNDIFFHHMSSAWKHFTPSLHNTPGGKTDIKRILMPLTGIIRLYSLRNGITGYSSIERILELYSGHYLDEQMLRETIKSWKDLTSLRLLQQASDINSGIEPVNIVDLNIDNHDLQYSAEQAIKTINNLMLKAASDFYTQII